MGTLLKCYKPLFSIRFSSFPSSLRTFQLRTHPSNNPRRRNPIRRCFSSLSPSQPLINGKSVDKRNGTRPASSSTELWLHNTMSKKKEVFKPKVEGKVGMYVCGVTAYDLSHIGHARVYVIFDVLYRYLKHLGYEVCYVRNFTDVDDKDS
ncbi:cysteine--tRNA ligase, chloroplastic/mitochondrial-like isoform X2 [Herrania umbratica]|uniref:Cysteine--tRNA ligase, chloroplastic/mitochondrial-like isoform X2 n=1 Tax=Herrania umbratica TaxID=108875 RepID=A0A6J1AWA8_9ROSI|nr:cysteine--tRNA ligase, chloroplastic/mitochondrial-like isoform X2 [Herrania umbratica]